MFNELKFPIYSETLKSEMARNVALDLISYHRFCHYSHIRNEFIIHIILSSIISTIYSYPNK